ncbi:MAG: hypothetical protein GWM88_00865, partial [Pseudomonadales bacterium]|nr:hypothetical protein [Pseudomonadales bacterium]NIX06641.1 hypothetical protein [Pseudomonadales bacterium]
MGRRRAFRIALRRSMWLSLLVLVIAVPNQPASAYIGPGAGFAFVGSLFVLLTTFF